MAAGMQLKGKENDLIKNRRRESGVTRPLNADALRLRKKSKRRVSQKEVERALAAFRELRLPIPKKMDSVKFLRKLRS